MDPKGTAPSQTFPPHLVWLLVALTLGWGFNWPIMKAVLFEMAPMHFRSLCLFFGAAGLFAITRLSGLPIRVPQGQWPRLIVIALVNMMGWQHTRRLRHPTDGVGTGGHPGLYDAGVGHDRRDLAFE